MSYLITINLFLEYNHASWRESCFFRGSVLHCYFIKLVRGCNLYGKSLLERPELHINTVLPDDGGEIHKAVFE